MIKTHNAKAVFQRRNSRNICGVIIAILFLNPWSTAAAQDGSDTSHRPSTTPATAQQVGPVTGYPIPRYVSINEPQANARRGPSRGHRIDWVFQRRDLPVIIVAEHGHWRRVVDRDGAGGWMHYFLLSGTRTAIVEADSLPMRQWPIESSAIRAQVETGVVGRLRECRPNWCQIDANGYRGWVETRGLWGVDPGETFD